MVAVPFLRVGFWILALGILLIVVPYVAPAVIPFTVDFFGIIISTFNVGALLLIAGLLALYAGI
ncbi:MAG: hypothetical protein ABIH90_02435 [Candidatus Aenigmatarchaeota archaeon]